MKIWLRIAAVLSALYAAAHTAGRPWTPLASPSERPVIDAMQGVHFVVFGVTRSYWDFYQGFGLSISALLLVQAVLLWQCAAMAAVGGGAPLRPLIATLLAGFLVNALLVAKYVFAPPMIFAAAISVCLAAALIGPRFAPRQHG
jgi:hypothetical protein